MFLASAPAQAQFPSPELLQELRDHLTQPPDCQRCGDLAALALSTGKPLTARLMPIPGLAAGEKVAFDFEYFADSRVIPVKNLSADNLFRRSSFFDLVPPRPRRKRK